jgi:hypothetical protein
MNQYALIKFTPQVLRGAESLGLAARALKALLKTDDQHLSEITFGIEELTAREARLIEKETDRTISELIVLGIERDMSPSRRVKNAELIRDTLAMVSSWREDVFSRAQPRVDRQRKPSRPAKKTTKTAKKRPSGSRARAT